MYKLVKNLIFLLAAATFVVSKRYPRDKSHDEHFTESQLALLEEIQVLARKAALPESEVDAITQFDANVCYDIDCLESAIEVMSATNFSVDPCKPKMWRDFACSRRVNGPDNIHQLERLNRKVEKQTIALLEDQTGTYDNEFLWKEAHTHYYQCKHKGQADDQDVIDILTYTEKYGNWPILTNKDPGEKFNWLDLVADLNRIERSGYKPYLLEVTVPDFTTSNGPIELQIGQTMVQASASDLQKMLKLIQTKTNSKKPVRTVQIHPMMTFMTTATFTSLAADPTETISIGALQNRTDEYMAKNKIEMPVNWLKFFNRVLEGTEGIHLSPEFNISAPINHIMGIIRVVNKFQTNKDKKLAWAVSNILHFQLVSTLLQETTVFLDSMNTFKCVEKSGDLTSICTDRITDTFGYSLGATYLKYFYDDETATPAVTDLVSYIKRGYVDIIAKTKWMENNTKEFLMDKINHIKTYIGYPSWMKDQSKLMEFFKGLELSTDKNSSYPLNYLALNSWRLQKKRSWSYKHLKMSQWKDFPLYEVEWNHYPGTVQAQYHKAINQARVEAGAIQKPIFGVSRPGFMNFGGLGMILAHEIGHSFDIVGRLFNKDGENEKEYWDSVSKKKYYEWVKTIAEHYGSEPYQLSETSAETVDGWKSINEDIADILAVYISYHSYQKYLKDLEGSGGKEKILPGLKTVSPHKLFYMKYANMWCDNKDVQDKYKDMLSDHSAGNTRATLPLKYSRQFARAFGCKLPDPVL